MAGNGVRAGALWNLVQYGGSKFLLFASTVALARILDAEAFGLLALGMVVVNVFDRFKDLGVGQAVVQSNRRTALLYPTANLLSTLAAIAFAGLCALSAPLIAAGFQNPALTDIIRALSLMVLIAGLAVFPDAVLRRSLRFSDRTVPELAGAAMKAAGSVFLALDGYGVWALVWGQLAGSLVTTIGYWIAALKVEPRMARPDFQPRVARELIHYGGTMVWLSLLSLALDNMDYVMIGRRLGENELGQYTVAFRLPELLVTGTCIVIGQVLFSSFSRLQGDLPALRTHFTDATRVVAMATVPIGLGLTAAAPSIIPALFGDQYPQGASILRWLGVYSVAYALTFHAGEVYKAMNRVRILIWLAVIKLVIMIPLFWICAAHSATAVAAALAGMHVVFTGLRLFIIRQELHLSAREQLATIAPSLGAGLAMAGGVTVVELFGGGLPDLLRMCVDVLVGAVIYLTTLHRLDPGHANLAQLRRLVGRGPAPAVEPMMSEVR